MAAPTGAVETTSDFGKTPGGTVQRWLAEIKAYDTSFKTWHGHCDKIVKRYRDEQDSETKRMRFNVLWSNIQTLGPAVYAKRPVPEVVRRNKDRDPVSLCAAEVLKRTLTTEIDLYDFDGQMKAGRDDYLLTARGQLWVRYVPQFGPETRDRAPVTVDRNEDGAPRYLADDGGELSPDGLKFDEAGQPYQEGEPYKPVVNEYVTCDHIHWRNFGHTPAPTWSKVTAVWKRELMTREKLQERFGDDLGGKIGLTVSIQGISEESKRAFGDVFKRGEVYEIWDLTTKRVTWISPGYTDAPLDEQPDPLGLEGFFPCPRPLYGTTTTDSLIPVPDYIEYQSQAVEIDNLTARLSLLTKALRVVGVYDASVGDKLKLLLDGDDNDMVPVDNWAMFAEKGGLQGSVSFLPIKEIADTALQLFNARAQIKRDLDEVTGLSDIVRGQGSTGPRTATEQRIKGQFATLRLQDRQTEVNRFVRDVLRIKAEIIAEHFSADTLLTASNWLNTANARALDRAATAAAQIDPNTGQPVAQQPVPGAAQVFEQAVQLLKDDSLRSFKIDIETDSTIFQDQQAEKQSRIEFLQSATQFLTVSVPAAQQYPELKPVLAEMLMFGVRAFATGSSLEDVFDQAMEDMEAAPSSPQQNAATAQAASDAQRAEIEQAKLQQQQQSDAQTHDLNVAKFQADVQDRQNQHEREMAKLALDRDRLAHEMNKHALDRQDMQDARRLDGKVTPTFEEDMQKMQDAMAALAASIAQLAQAQTAAIQNQDQQMTAMLAALTAPKKLVRDAQGRPAGVEVDMSRMN